MIGNQSNVQVKYFYSRADVAGMLGISVVTLDRLTKRGAINHCRMSKGTEAGEGRRVMFKLEDIQEFVNKQGA